MSFVLSSKSLWKMETLHPDLVKVVKRAIELTSVDFTVHETDRTLAKQSELVCSGASTTMNSRHIVGLDGYAKAVDLVALLGGSLRWDWPLYHKIAESMKLAAEELTIPLEWGGVWDKRMSQYESPELECEAYVARKYAEYKKKGVKKRPFIDGPHFQLPHKEYP